MTQKSDGRKERDARAVQVKEQLKGNNNWTDLHTQYMLSKQLLTAPGAIAFALNNPALLNCIADLDTFNTNVRLLTSDIKAFSVDLDKIFSKHSTRHGHADESNIMEAFSLVDEYAGFNVRYETVMLPTILHILEQTSQAEKILREKQAVAADQAVPQSVEEPTA